MGKTLKFGGGTWATKKGSTLAYNDLDGNFKPLPFTYTGAGKGTRVNKEGLIEVVENDRPRIDYLDSEDGVFLLEKASTNKITYSEDFSQSVWTKSNSSITSNSLISPDGTLNADLLTQTSDGGIIRFNTTYSGFETVSVFAKKGSANFIGLFSAGNEVYFDLNNGISASYSGATIVNYGIQSYGNGWYRCYLTTNYTGSSSVRVYPSETDGGSASSTESIYIYGSQLEVGNLSSYIPTQGTIPKQECKKLQVVLETRKFLLIVKECSILILLLYLMMVQIDKYQYLMETHHKEFILDLGVTAMNFF